MQHCDFNFTVFDVFAAGMSVMVFWVVTPCGIMNGYQRLG
jgi:hypothetical protein